MSHGPFHRTGTPGGAPCKAVSLDITAKQPDGTPYEAVMLDGGPQSSEVELLRAVALSAGVRWGHDELGWWAVIPGRLTARKK